MQERVWTLWIRRTFSFRECWSNITNFLNNLINYQQVLTLFKLREVNVLTTPNLQWTKHSNVNIWIKQKWSWSTNTVAEHRCNSRYDEWERDLLNLSSGLEWALIVALSSQSLFSLEKEYWETSIVTIF